MKGEAHHILSPRLARGAGIEGLHWHLMFHQTTGYVTRDEIGMLAQADCELVSDEDVLFRDATKHFLFQEFLHQQR